MDCNPPGSSVHGALPFPTPGDLSDPGYELTSLESPALAGAFFTTELPGKPEARGYKCKFHRGQGPWVTEGYLLHSQGQVLLISDWMAAV